VPGLSAKLHHKHWRARYLCFNHFKIYTQFIIIGTHADALTSTTFRCFEHDGITDSICRFKTLVNRCDHRLVEDVYGYRTFFSKNSFQTVSRPWDGGNFGGLCKNVCSNFVAKNRHHRCGGTNKQNTAFLQSSWEFWVLGCVPPSRPNCIDPLALGYVDNQIDVCVVVLVGSTWNLYKIVSIPYKLGVGLQIFWRCHDEKFNSIFIADFIVCPTTHGNDGFCGSHSIVRNENFPNNPLATMCSDIAGKGFGRSRVCTCICRGGYRCFRTSNTMRWLGTVKQPVIFPGRCRNRDVD